MRERRGDHGTPEAGDAPLKVGPASRALHTQFLLFALIGVGNASIDAAVFAFLVGVVGWSEGVMPLVASVAGFVVGVTHSYAWNSRVTFRVGRTADRPAVLGQFLSVAAGGAVVSAIAFSVVRALWPDAGTTLAVSKLGAIGTGMVWNFSLMRGWVFSSRRLPPAGESDEAGRRGSDSV